MEKRGLFVLFLVLVGFLLVVFFIGSQTAKAATLTVSANGGQQYTTIQRAVNVSSTGDTVYVYNGMYYINWTSGITISKSINLVGESNQNTIIRGTGAGDSNGIYITTSNVNISNLKVDNFYYGIDLGGTNNNIIISSNTITNCSSGMSLYGSNNNITYNTIMNCSYGIHLYGSNNNILSNTITNRSNYSISLSGSNNNITSNTLAEGIFLDTTSVAATLQNNTVGGKPLYFAKNINSIASPIYIENSAYGQVILCNCSGFVIRNNNFNGATLLILSSSNNNITSNTITNSSNGICLYISSNNNITSNTVTNSYYGIFLYRSSNSIVTSNTITNCDGYGIYLSAGSNNNITSNTITNCGQYGISVFSSSNYNNITSNTLASSTCGVYLSGSNNNITFNTVTNCSWNGILLYGSNNNILSNTITNSGDSGIYISGSNSIVTSNTITNSNRYGMYISGSNSIVTSNTITNSNRYGMYLSGSNNNVTSNNIYDNEQYGLYQHSGTGNRAINNWWGSEWGPYNGASNPYGNGDNITDGVPFSPWATTPFSIATSSTNQSANHAPTITSISPQYGIVNTTFYYQVNASDADNDTLTYATNISTINATGLFSYTPNTTGIYNITITVNDTKTQTSITFVLTINATTITPTNNPPTVTITSSFNDKVNGTISITGTASDDAAVDSVQINIDNGGWITTTGTTSWSYSLDTTKLVDGKHTIKVRVYDGTQYSTEQMIEIDVNNAKQVIEPKKESKGFLPGFETVMLLAVLGLYVLIVNGGRKRRR